MSLDKDYEKESTGLTSFNQESTNKNEKDVSDFVDNSPDAIEAGKLQESADNSPDALEARRMQEVADKDGIETLQQKINQHETDVEKIRESYSGDGQVINGVIVKYKTKNDDDGYYKLTYPDGTVERIQPHEFEFYAKDLGYNVFLQSIIEEEFSVEASMFLLALGANESSFGTDNGGDEYHNMFSIMGGSKENIGTGDGHLQKFDSWEEGFSDGLVKQIVDGYRKEDKKFPLLRNLLESNGFSIDDINEAFGQYNYHKHNENEKSASNSYDGNEKTNFGLRYTKSAINRIIPMMILDFERRVQNLEKDLEANPSINPQRAMKIVAYKRILITFQDAKITLEQKVADYEKEQKKK
jgi:hypothetical protein